MKSRKCFFQCGVCVSAVALTLSCLACPARAGKISGTTRLLDGKQRPDVAIQAFECFSDGRIDESVDLLKGTGSSNAKGDFTISIPDEFHLVVLRFVAKDGRSKIVYSPEPVRSLGMIFGGALWIEKETDIKGLNVVVPNLDPPVCHCRCFCPANLSVRLPAEARLTIDEALTISTGKERSYISPPLAPGVSYAYTLKVSVEVDGKAHEIVREVEVRAGQTTYVNFEDAFGNARVQR